MRSNFNVTKWFRDKYIAEANWKQLTPEEMEKYSDDVIGLIKIAYEYVGGHANLKTADDVEKDIRSGSDYEIIDLDGDGEPDAVNISKERPSGTKFTGTGHNGTKPAKRAVIGHKIEKLQKPGFYIEVSGRIKEILMDAGVPIVTDEETIRKVIKKSDIKMVGDGVYSRLIGGKMHEKSLLGRPYNK